jgi:hypothetical protein
MRVRGRAVRAMMVLPKDTWPRMSRAGEAVTPPSSNSKCPAAKSAPTFESFYRDPDLPSLQVWPWCWTKRTTQRARRGTSFSTPPCTRCGWVEGRVSMDATTRGQQSSLFLPSQAQSPTNPPILLFSRCSFPSYVPCAPWIQRPSHTCCGPTHTILIPCCS